MKALGGLLFLIGVVSIGLFFADKELRYLSWIHQWGDGFAWGIRGGLVAVGGLLWLAGGKKKQPA